MRKILLSITLGCVIALASAKKKLTAATARVYVDETAQYDAELPCYSCIINNFIYCQKGDDHPAVAKGKTAPQGYCCQSYDTCPYVNDASYSCSSSYADTLFSLRMCPFFVEKCGDQDSLVISKTGAAKSFSQTMLPGDVCFYTTRAECGVPTLSPSGDNVGDLDIYTIQYDDDEVEQDYYAEIDDSNKKVVKGNANVVLPTKSSPLTEESAEYNYYTPYYFSYQRNGSYWSAWLNYDCSFFYQLDNVNYWFSAWNCDNRDFFNSKYLNPYYGYRYMIEPVDSANSSFRVIFTNGVTTLYPKANATQTNFPEGSSVTIDYQGYSYFTYKGSYTSYYYDPSATDSYYNGTNGTDGWGNDTSYDDTMVKSKYRDQGCDVTKLSWTDYSQGPAYSYICSNGSYIYFPSAWYNYTYKYWDYSCNSTQNWTYASNSSSNSSNSSYTDYYYNYYDYGCEMSYSYFTYEVTLKYQFFANKSYAIYYNDSTIDQFQYIDLYGAGYMSYVREWTNGTCQMFDDTYGMQWAKCANGSTLFYPPDDWFYSYYYYFWNNPDDTNPSYNTTSNSTVKKVVRKSQVKSIANKASIRAEDYETQYQNITSTSANPIWHNPNDSYTYITKQPVEFYDLQADGSYRIIYENGTIVNVSAPNADMTKYASNANQTLWWSGPNFTFNPWSPDYWNQTDFESGTSFFFNSSSSKWQMGYWTYYDTNDYYQIIYNNLTHNSTPSTNNSNGSNQTHSNNTSQNHTSSNQTTYNYVDKNGPRQYKYDASQNGKIVYKQDDQTTAKGAIKSDPYEPICKGRNQIVIVGDPRILETVYSKGRRLAIMETTAEAKTASVKMETVAFISDGIASNGILTSLKVALLSAMAIIALML